VNRNCQYTEGAQQRLRHLTDTLRSSWTKACSAVQRLSVLSLVSHSLITHFAS